MLGVVRPTYLSLFFHLIFILFFFLLMKFDFSKREVIEVPIEIEAPKEAQNLSELKAKPKIVLKSVNGPAPDKLMKREVFGFNRQSYTDESLGQEGIAGKKGNTLAKEVDKTQLNETDVDSLPTPTEDYLVSEMPSVLSEIRPIYPKEAREKEIEGSVVMDVLIDEKGTVRQVTVIDGPEIFRSGAVLAMKKFTFRPARVEGRPVPVRIRYSLKFQLEY
jgi:TonB family protein